MASLGHNELIYMLAWIPQNSIVYWLTMLANMITPLKHQFKINKNTIKKEAVTSLYKQQLNVYFFGKWNIDTNQKMMDKMTDTNDYA